MVTNGRVIHMMGHATQALNACASREAHANQDLKPSGQLGGEFRHGGGGRRVAESRTPEGKVLLDQSGMEMQGVFYNLPRSAFPWVT